MAAAGFDSIQLQQSHRDARPPGSPVSDAYARAEGYAWGWQDVRSEPVDTAEATAFAHADALLSAELLTQQRCVVRSVGGAWRAWRESGGLAVGADQAAR